MIHQCYVIPKSPRNLLNASYRSIGTCVHSSSFPSSARLMLMAGEHVMNCSAPQWDSFLYSQPLPGWFQQSRHRSVQEAFAALCLAAQRMHCQNINIRHFYSDFFFSDLLICENCNAQESSPEKLPRENWHSWWTGVGMGSPSPLQLSDTRTNKEKYQSYHSFHTCMKVTFRLPWTTSLGMFLTLLHATIWDLIASRNWAAAGLVFVLTIRVFD